MATQIGPVAVSDKVMLYGGAAVIVLIVAGAWYAKRKVGEAVDATKEAVNATAAYIAKDAVNVTSQKNVANLVVNKTLQATGILGTNDITGKPNTIGSAVYELFN